MRKIKRQESNNYYHGIQASRQYYTNNRQKQAEKTIVQLKESINSIQKMIQKSQKLLVKTRPLNSRQVRSDSLELKLNALSRQKSNGKPNITNHYKLNQLSQTTLTRYNTKSKQTLILPYQYNSPKVKLPQKTKPQRPYLYIDTQALNEEQSQKTDMFIYDTRSPASAMTRQRVNDQSFAESLENTLNFARRLRTQGLNDSYERSLLGESLQRQRYSSIQRPSQNYQNRKRQLFPSKKVILKRKNNNLNLNHMRTFTQLQQHHYHSSKPKQQPFEQQVSKNINKIKKGKYSYFVQNPQISIKRGENYIAKNKQQSSQRNIYDSKQKNHYCLKFNKQNDKNQLDEFYQKVRKFGFVQRYLNYNQIGCIHEYLKRSSIPQHKWPLYVVDKVYQKMQNISARKN